MNEERLLAELGAQQRERDAEQVALESFAGGGASASDTVNACVAAGMERTRAEQLVSVLEPADDAERWVEACLDAYGEDTASTEPPVDRAGSKTRGGWWTAAVALAAAALAVLWVLGRGSGLTEDEVLPGYTWVVRNEVVRPERGDAPASTAAAYRPGSDISWFVRPDHGIDDSVVVAIVARRDGDAPQVFVPPPDVTRISERGVVHLGGKFGAVVPVPPGRWELRVLVGRARPVDAKALRRGGPWRLTAPSIVEVLP